MDIEEIKKSIKQNKDNNRQVEQLVKKLVNECCKDLDDLMDAINRAVSDYDNPVSDKELDFFILNLPIRVYYAYEQSEMLGLAEDRAKQSKNNAYAEAYSSEEGTIVERKQYAERSTLNHQVVVSIYSRAAKQIRNKLDIANETLQSLKKVSTKRMNEYNAERMSFSRGVDTNV